MLDKSTMTSRLVIPSMYIRTSFHFVFFCKLRRVDLGQCTQCEGNKTMSEVYMTHTFVVFQVFLGEGGLHPTKSPSMTFYFLSEIKIHPSPSIHLYLFSLPYHFLCFQFFIQIFSPSPPVRIFQQGRSEQFCSTSTSVFSSVFFQTTFSYPFYEVIAIAFMFQYLCPNHCPEPQEVMF